jgi:hypothetical protein
MTQELIADMLGVRREASPRLRRLQQNDFTKRSMVLRRPDKKHLVLRLSDRRDHAV